MLFTVGKDKQKCRNSLRGQAIKIFFLYLRIKIGRYCLKNIKEL